MNQKKAEEEIKKGLLRVLSNLRIEIKNKGNEKGITMSDLICEILEQNLK